MKRISAVLLFLATIIMVSSCCPCRKRAKNPLMLDSNPWRLTEMNLKQGINKDQSESFTVRFDDVEKKVSGTADCNRFFGNYKLEPSNKIKFESIGGTRMMCRTMDAEAEFLKTIAIVDSYTIDGDVLLLQKNGEVVMIFEAVKAVKVVK